MILSETIAFSALTLLVGRQEGHLAWKKTEWWGAGVVICLERDADLHMAQLMPLPLTVSCFSEIQIGFTFLEPAHPGCPGKRAIKRVCVCVCYQKLTNKKLTSQERNFCNRVLHTFPSAGLKFSKYMFTRRKTKPRSMNVKHFYTQNIKHPTTKENA